LMIVVFWGVWTTPVLKFLPRGESMTAAKFQLLVLEELHKHRTSIPEGEQLYVH
jgi:hypothetical protein